MNLGLHVQIAIGVPDVQAAAEFYEKLEFQKLASGNKPYPWVQFSDGVNLILLNQDGQIYRGLIYYNPNLNELFPELSDVVDRFTFVQRGADHRVHFALFTDPTAQTNTNHNWLGVQIVAQDGSALPQPSKSDYPLCGRFEEFSAAVPDFSETKMFWEKLGFSCAEPHEEPYPWGLFSDGRVTLGFHQQLEEMKMPLPSLTYFSADSAERIAKIKELGYDPVFEMKDQSGTVTHAGFSAPDGQPILVFHE